MSRQLASALAKLLICVLIAGLVVGLFLTAVSRVRESANQMKCQNNLKQLGLAIHNYHDTNDCLPPLVDLGDGAITGDGVPSLFAQLMQYVECDPWNYRSGRPIEEYHAHSSMSFTFECKGDVFTENGGVVNQYYRKTFLCPSDNSAHELRDIPMTLPAGSIGYYAAGSYAANGLVPWATGTLKESFPRGMANTILMAERPQVCRTAAGEDVYNLWGVGFYSPHMAAFATLTPAGHPEWESTGQIGPMLPLPSEESDIQFRVGRADAAPQAADFATPIQRVRNGRTSDPRLPGSYHRTGMAVLMADGSVRVFEWDTTSLAFWQACVPTNDL